MPGSRAGRSRNSPRCGRRAAGRARTPPQTPVFRPVDPAQPGATAARRREANAGVWVPRTVTFAELGFTEPVVLGYPDTISEIYLPVPPGRQPVRRRAAAGCQLRARRRRPHHADLRDRRRAGGRPTASPPTAATPAPPIPVDGEPRPSGFVRLNIDWRTAVARENTCADARTPGNILRIEPTSRFVFRYDGSAHPRPDHGLGRAAAGADHPGRRPTSCRAEAYDAAWRVGVALERAGKRPRSASRDGSAAAHRRASPAPPSRRPGPAKRTSSSAGPGRLQADRACGT